MGHKIYRGDDFCLNNPLALERDRKKKKREIYQREIECVKGRRERDRDSKYGERNEKKKIK